jgi:hypothetical protein
VLSPFRPLTAALLLILAVPAFGQSAAQGQATDQQITEIIIRQSRQAYYATGHPCACPDDLARNGSRCGGRSAYSRPGGAEPKCYPKDVTAAEIARYRAGH